MNTAGRDKTAVPTRDRRRALKVVGGVGASGVKGDRSRAVIEFVFVGDCAEKADLARANSGERFGDSVLGGVFGVDALL